MIFHEGKVCWLRNTVLCLQVVDMVMLKSFRELTDTDVTSDPLILLPCGHVFTTSTLDGHMAMAEAYSCDAAANNADRAGCDSGVGKGITGSNSSGGRAVPGKGQGLGQLDEGSACDAATDLQPWTTPLYRSDFPPPKGCPDCRKVIAGVKRYGRVVLHSQLGVTQRKHAEAIRWVWLTQLQPEMQAAAHKYASKQSSEL